MSTPTAAILIIGNEILSGRTPEGNVHYMATRLCSHGIVLRETRTIPDEESIIMDAVQTLSQKYTYVFTTGGIGATHDDITAASVAKAFHRKLILHPEALRILIAFYQDRFNETRKRLALIPEGAALIENLVSAAPGFRIGNVYCLAGIPLVMQAMFDRVLPTLTPGPTIFSKTIRCSVPENNLADELGIIQQKYTDVDIGSYPRVSFPGPYELNLVLRCTHQEHLDAATLDVIQLIQRHGQEPTVTE